MAVWVCVGLRSYLFGGEAVHVGGLEEVLQICIEFSDVSVDCDLCVCVCVCVCVCSVCVCV